MKKLFALILSLAIVACFTGCPMIKGSEDGGGGNGGTVGEAVVFQDAVQTGGITGTANSTNLTLTFDADPTTLSADNITVIGATKGALTGGGTTRNLAISNIIAGNGSAVSVTVTNPTGYSISGSPKSAVVYRSLTIGMDYLGGKIGYIMQSGDPGYDAGIPHGLIAATADQSNGIKWYNGTFTIVGVTATAMGTGKSNTTTIINNQGVGNYAAQLCDDYINSDTGTGVYSDWFLPSLDELNKLYLNKTVIGGFLDGNYWCSSESTRTYNYAWAEYFTLGIIYDYATKDNSFRVRAVRSF